MNANIEKLKDKVEKAHQLLESFEVAKNSLSDSSKQNINNLDPRNKQGEHIFSLIAPTLRCYSELYPSMQLRSNLRHSSSSRCLLVGLFCRNHLFSLLTHFKSLSNIRHPSRLRRFFLTQSPSNFLNCFLIIRAIKAIKSLPCRLVSLETYILSPKISFLMEAKLSSTVFFSRQSFRISTALSFWLLVIRPKQPHSCSDSLYLL